MAVQVDDPSLGNLAKPRERIAVADLRGGQRPDRFGARLLKKIVRLDLARPPGALLPLDERHELRAMGRNEVGQRLRIAVMNPRDQFVAHAASLKLERATTSLVEAAMRL